VRVDADFSDEFPDGDPIATEIVATLVRTGEAASDEIERAMLASFGVGEPVLNALAVIDGSPEPLTPKMIGERTLKSSGTITGTLDTLELQGWIRRINNPDDRRSVLIEITDAGRAVIDRMLPGIRVIDKLAVAALDAAEREQLMRLLDKVLRTIATVAEAEPTVLDGTRNRPKRLSR
jgi:DNA-binding MarR family transcriptional regulator